MICQNCGHVLEENFCPQCGEKRFNKKELTVKHFFLETLESFLHFDNRFFRSLKKLVLKPGELSVDFVEGKRVNVMKPLQLFLVLNISLFFLPGNPFALSIYNYITYKPFINYNTRNIVKEKIEKENISFKEFANIFEEKIKSESKEFVFLYIPFYGLIFALLFIFNKLYYTEHLVFATHFMGFYVLLSIFDTICIQMPFYYFTQINYSSTFDTFTTLLTQIIIGVYLFLAIRKFYQSSIFWSLFTAASIAATFFIFIQYYRMFLFFKIIYLD